MEKNPILIIDDDLEDLELISEAFKELKIENELVCFDEAKRALDFLRNSDRQPLFILCDVNMNSINGFEFRQEIYDDVKLRLKCIPFLFLSTAGNRHDITKAYNLSVQGYFKKPDSYIGIVNMLRSIIQYWDYCQHPNSKELRNN
ncbi:response regulator [Segetibacter koreensis]|uniref:response regulator n=1 Tax=Segetibacter koreensis TaxID=398037 RepID=UPI00036EE1E4|nr:response regulator [Segetibacter koreensis]